MMAFAHTISGTTYRFKDLKDLLAKATPARSGDDLAGVAASSEIERAAAKFALADLPLKHFLEETVIPYEVDEITRLIVDRHHLEAFAPVAHLTVGQLREWILEQTDSSVLHSVGQGLTPEMVAAVSKLMRNQDLILAASRMRVVTRFRSTIGLPGTMAVRLQPNHPTDDPKGILASIIDGIMYGCGDAVIGINPASDNTTSAITLLNLLEEFRTRLDAPVQSCVLTHITHTLEAIRQNAPVDLVFQSIAGTERANTSFGVSLSLLREAHDAALSLRRGTIGTHCMYFETGQGSALSAGANFGVDQQTCEVRAYAVARAFDPLLVNTVVGFIGPEYLFDSKQIIRAGLEDHFCGKLLGLPMGCDICYTNHAEADQDDMDSFHDALYVRNMLGLKRAPEFEEWLRTMQIVDSEGRFTLSRASLARLLPAGAFGSPHEEQTDKN
jgi:ethanolamine ammonia-lyase large subunit